MEPSMTPDDVVEVIMRRLTEHGRVVPGYVIRDAVEAALRRQFPGVPPAGLTVPPELAAELVTSFGDGAAVVEDDSATMPAVLSGDETGRLMAGLGLAVHVAAFNLDRDRLHVAQILNGSAAALVALGAASRAAHADGTSAVLLSPATLRTVRTTMIAVLQGVRSRGWQAEHLNPVATTTMFTDVLTMLGAVP